MDFDLLFNSPLYLVKHGIRKRVKEWGQELDGLILDVGCGRQIYRKFLPACWNYVGLDLNLDWKPEVAGSALTLPFVSDSFDHILCIEVLEHLPEPEKALREMARVIKPTGKLLFSTPMTWYLHYEPNDYFRFTKYGLLYLLEKTNFNVLQIDTKGGFCTIVLSRIVELIFHLFYYLTKPVYWLTGKNRGRFRLAVILTLPFTLIALFFCSILDFENGLYVQGWVVLAEKNNK